MKVLLYGSEVKHAESLSLGDRVSIFGYDNNMLCNISKNLYHMLKERGYVVEVDELRNIDNNLYNIIAKMTGLVR